MKTALVTGGNRGIGLATVKKLSEMGYKVYMGVRSQEKAEQALSEIKDSSNIVPLIMELENESQIEQAYKTYLQIKEPNETLDVLINNAAAGLDWVPDVSHISTFDIEYSMLEKMFRINTLAALFMLRHFLPSMSKDARVVNVASGSGEFWDPNASKDFQPGYATTKAALIMLTKKMASAAIEKNVYVNCCCPGWCRTATGSWNADTSPEDGAGSVIATLFLDSSTPPYGHHYRYGQRIPIDVLPYDIYLMYNQETKISFLQQVFSIRNEGKYKVVRILGIKIKIKRGKNAK